MPKTEITVVKEFEFEAAHYLPDYDGPCKRMHGHSYRLQVGMTGSINPKTGMVIDFSKLKKLVGEFVDFMDHECLNTIKSNAFPAMMPTAEYMVLWLSLKLTSFLRQEEPRLTFIRLYETPTSYAEWRAE